MCAKIPSDTSRIDPLSLANSLKIASSLNKSFEILLDAYKQIAQNFPLLFKYRSLFQDNPAIRKILVWIYEDTLKFHLRAFRIFARSGMSIVNDENTV